MKTAYQYIRISDEDQSNFSISGQQKLNEEFADRLGIRMIEAFIDDGYSAKDFNRPSWKRLEAALAKNKNRIDYLIVSKYDRLVRNAAEALTFMDKLEKKWNIKLLSVQENFSIDPDSPFFFKIRADMFVNAEFERRVIADRTKFGLWAAKSQGRFIGVAPMGYKNSRDENDKPIIVVDEDMRPTIETVFSDYLNNVPIALIASKVKATGRFLKGNGSVKRILTNYAYAGLVKVPQYKDGVQKIIKGIHEPIVSEATFWKAYYRILDETRPVVMKPVDDNIPLRGFLLCDQCGELHTGAKSKGMTKYFYYYWCHRCGGKNFNADKVHKSISFILENLSLRKPFIEALKVAIERQMDERLKGRDQHLKKVKHEHEIIKDRMHSLESKYIDNKISDQMYQKWQGTYTEDLNRKQLEIDDLTRSDEKFRQLLNDRLPMVSDLNYLYSLPDVPGKHQFLRGIFPGSLYKTLEGFRTPIINDMFYQSSLKIGALLEVSREGVSVKNTPFSQKCPRREPFRTPDEGQIEHFLTIIDQIMTAKVA